MQWTAAILAGGRARRFGGRDKSGLVVDGRSILDRQLDELARVTDDILIVRGAGAPAAGGAPAGGARGGVTVRVVADRVPDCGPLGGLHTALTESTAGAVALVACDMPFVTGPLVAYLVALAADADIVVPRDERGYHPLCAVYTRACADAVAGRIAERKLKMSDLFEDVRVRVVTADELDRFGDLRRLLANVNTEAAFRDLEALQGHQL